MFIEIWEKYMLHHNWILKDLTMKITELFIPRVRFFTLNFEGFDHENHGIIYSQGQIFYIFVK